MKIAYMFSVYKDFDYLARILKMLREPWADFYVHIDKKSKINLKKYIKENNLEYVNFIKKRMSVYWGGFTQIQSTLKIFKEIKNSGIKYDRIVFLTDGEFPLWSNQKIYNFFSKEDVKDKEIMSIAIEQVNDTLFEPATARVDTYVFFDSPITRFFDRETIAQRMWLFQRLQRHMGITKKMLPLEYYRGNSKFYITQDFMEYVLDYIKLNPDDLNTFKHTNCADEVFFQTVFMNSEFSDKHINQLFRYHVWGQHAPIPLDISHKEKIMNMKPFVVAKLNQGYSDELFAFLENNRVDD